jgi:FMN phosphatase YigB (HAD superfamily)
MKPLVILLDVDNTLFDNDGFTAELSAHLGQEFGSAARERYWALYEQRRESLGYADYLGALQDFRTHQDVGPSLLQMSAFLLDYPFARHLYPRALEAIAHLRTLGLPVVLSDGDIVFQPRKVQRAGIWDAVAGRALIYPHKQHALEAVQRHYPGEHYVMIDDKPQVLAALKQVMGICLTTVFVRQGHYAHESPAPPTAVPPDLTIERIGDVAGLGAGDLRLPVARSRLLPENAAVPD